MEAKKMLLQFSCSNHKSIKDAITFSMIASKEDSNLDGLKKFHNVNVLRIASIYGANGSGKSNFIDAMGFAQNLIINSFHNQPGNPLVQFPHKLSAPTIPSKYDFQFVREDIRYAYGFAIKDGFIDEEYLYYFPNNRKTKIFERRGMNIIEGSKYKKSFYLSKETLKPNRLFLTCAANYSKINEIEQAFMFFSLDLILYHTVVDEPRIDNWYEYSVELIEKNPEIKDAFLEILRGFDTGIVNVNAKIINVDLEELKKTIPEPIANLMFHKDFNNETLKNVQVKMIYENFETDLMSEESTGIKQLFKIICPVMNILIQGKVLVCDEIETGLHESLVHQLLKLFYVLVPEKFAQLIFTTHDTSLLDLEFFRRDQIWFTQLNSERATELYSLVEVRNVRKHENFSKGYIAGKYGAIPMLNQNFVKQIESLREK